jgi:hypothetical protein
MSPFIGTLHVLQSRVSPSGVLLRFSPLMAHIQEVPSRGPFPVGPLQGVPLRSSPSGQIQGIPSRGSLQLVPYVGPFQRAKLSVYASGSHQLVRSTVSKQGVPQGTLPVFPSRSPIHGVHSRRSLLEFPLMGSPPGVQYGVLMRVPSMVNPSDVPLQGVPCRGSPTRGNLQVAPPLGPFQRNS